MHSVKCLAHCQDLYVLNITKQTKATVRAGEKQGHGKDCIGRNRKGKSYYDCREEELGMILRLLIGHSGKC